MALLRPRARLTAVLALVCLLSLRLSVSASASDPADLPEYVIKAGFLFNFAKYVDWPADAFERPDAPISIGIVGRDPFGAELERILQGKKVKDRPFTIVRFSGAADIRRCHILFVPRTEASHLAGILEHVDGLPVLTVGEADAFTRAGGTVSVLVENDRPRLEINTDAAGRAGLTISTKLLKAATLVRTVK